MTALKGEPGGDIGLSGSVSVVRQLLAAGLPDDDELYPLVHPIVLGRGMRLFGETEQPIPLRLLSSAAFSTGVLHLVHGFPDAPGIVGYEDAKRYLAQ